MRLLKLDARLSAAADFVRQGAVFADIGSDHALLPVFLLRSGRIRHAVVSDVAPGPLARGEATLREHGLLDRATLLLANGLTGMEDLGLTDIAICGMGGELIARILAAAPFVKNGDLRLILLPMSRPAELRRYLAAEGFALEGEVCVEANEKCYFCLCARYTGIPYVLTRLEAELGQACHRRPTPALCRKLALLMAAAEKKCRGMETGGQDSRAERAYLTELEQLYETYTMA